MIGSKGASSARSFESAWTNDGERKRSSEGTGGDGAAVAPVPSGRSAPASATNRLAPAGNDHPPGAGLCVGDFVFPPGPLRRNATAAARRAVAFRAPGRGRLRAP